MKTIICTTDDNDICVLKPHTTVFSLEFGNKIEDTLVDDDRDFDLSVETAGVLIAELQEWLVTQK